MRVVRHGHNTKSGFLPLEEKDFADIKWVNMTGFGRSQGVCLDSGDIAIGPLAWPNLSRKQACLSQERAVKRQVKLTSCSYTMLLQPKRDKAWRDPGRCRCGHCCVINWHAVLPALWGFPKNHDGENDAKTKLHAQVDRRASIRRPRACRMYNHVEQHRPTECRHRGRPRRNRLLG